VKSKSKIFLKWSVRSNLIQDIQNPSPFLFSLPACPALGRDRGRKAGEEEKSEGIKPTSNPSSFLCRKLVPGIGNSVFSRCKFFDRISLRPLVKIHPIPQPNRLRRNILQTNQVSATGLKWLEPVPSTCCVLIGTDIALNPFLQALVRSSQQFRHWTSDFTHQTSLF
jgi:hypothetical protein